MQKFHFDKNAFTLTALKIKVASLKYDKVFRNKCIFVGIELLVLACIITLDLCMKDYLYNLLAATDSGNMTLIDGFMDLTYSVNTGAGFGLFKDSTTVLTVVTAVVISAVLIYLLIFHTDSEWLRMPLVLISAGGIGNLVDRIALGYVRDFFEFTFFDFAIFNVADAFVTIGSAWLIIYLIVLLFKESSNIKKDAKKTDGDGSVAESDSDNPSSNDVKDTSDSFTAINATVGASDLAANANEINSKADSAKSDDTNEKSALDSGKTTDNGADNEEL